MKYTPKSGVNAGKTNREKVREILNSNSEVTGAYISKVTGLSLPTVYSHLKAINEGK